MPRVSYDIPRQRTWAWKVSSYIWTKSIAAGAALVPAIMHLTGVDTSGTLFAKAAPLVALAALALTGVLLVADLKRPERFWTILIRPQWRSWLAKGAFVITAYGAVLAGWAWASWYGQARWLDVLSWLVIPLALLTAVYTAFLFAQCEGRDLWQSRWLAFQLLVHAMLAGVAVLLFAARFTGGSEHLVSWGEAATVALFLSTLLALIDAFGQHATANAAAAAHALTRGPQARLFWFAIALGALVPAGLFLVGPLSLYAAAAALALAGLWLHGHALVLAGQGPPIS